ncbi:MAG: DUF2231 domain-containing protein [Actinomycetota bacterium]
MEIDNLFGVPAHPLLVHFPLLLIPLAVLSAFGAVLVPRHRRRLAWFAAGVTAIALVSVQFAIGSGETLQDRVKKTDLVRRHASMGDSVRLYGIVLLVALLVLALLPQSSWTAARAQRRRVAVTAVSLFVVVAGIANIVELIRVGHSGAKAVWNDTPPAGTTPSSPTSSDTVAPSSTTPSSTTPSSTTPSSTTSSSTAP